MRRENQHTRRSSRSTGHVPTRPVVDEDERKVSPAAVGCPDQESALQRILGICDEATWSNATKIKRIKATAQANVKEDGDEAREASP